MALRHYAQRGRTRGAARRLRSAGGEAPLRGRRVDRALPPRAQGVPAGRTEPGAQRVQRWAARCHARPDGPAHAAPRVRRAWAEGLTRPREQGVFFRSWSTSRTLAPRLTRARWADGDGAVRVWKRAADRSWR